MRLFLDANILFSAAHNQSGNAAALFLLAERGHCELLSSRHAIEEARRNITSKCPEQIDVLERLISSLDVCPDPSAQALATAARHGLPAKDTPILGAAVHSDCDLLVTGDRSHFGHLYGKVVDRTRILTPLSALRHVLDAISM